MRNGSISRLSQKPPAELARELACGATKLYKWKEQLTRCGVSFSGVRAAVRQPRRALRREPEQVKREC